MYNGVGGGLVQWAAMWQPLLASDFWVRTLDGVADDWPIGWSDLAEPYARVAHDMSVSGLGGDPALPDMDPYPNPPIPIGKIGHVAAEGWIGWDGTGGPAPTPSPHGAMDRFSPASAEARAWWAVPRTQRPHRHSPTGHRRWPRGPVWLPVPGRRRYPWMSRVGLGRGVPRHRRSRVLSARTGCDAGRQRGGNSALAAAVGVAQVPRRPGQLLGSGGAPAHAAPLSNGHRCVRRSRSIAGRGPGVRASTPWSLPRPAPTVTS